MALKLVHGQLSTHPITRLNYPLVRETLKFSRHSLEIERLSDVEAAIDLVFSWLEGENLESSEIEHLAPYFGTVWASALALAQWIAEMGDAGRLKEKTILEIGCGLGIPGLLATKYGAVVTMSDGHPDVVRFLQKNIELNGNPEIQFAVPDWNSGSMLASTYDFVIASDVLYEAQHAALFSEVMTRHAGPKSTIVLVDPGRAYIQRFVNQMQALGWRECLTPWTVRHKGRNVDVFLLTFENG